MNRRVITYLIIVAILAGASLIAYLYINSKPEPRIRPNSNRVLSVKAYQESIGDFPITVSYPARVVSQDVVALGVEAGGKIESGDVSLKQGATFKKGELLFKINSSDIEAKLMSAKSQLITSISRVLPDIKYDLGEEYEKWEQFFNSIDLERNIPALPKANSSKERVYMATNNIISQYSDIVSLEILYNKHFIYAPFDGVFSSVSKEVGAIVSANSQVGVISATNHLDVVAGVSIVDATRINIGETATVKTRSGSVIEGKVSRVSSYVDSKTQMVDIYINIYDSNMDILEGEMVDVVIPAGTLTDVVKLPIEAIINNNLIYGVDADSRIYPISISILYEIDEWAYATGVKDGEMVVQESIITPSNGLKVNVINEHID